MDNTLEIKGIQVLSKSSEKSFHILRGVNLSIGKNESVALVGESGSGKTMTGMSIIQLLPGNIFVDRGSILIQGRNILELKEADLRRIRGNKTGMIFQEPSSYLNPLFTIGSQISEAIKGRCKNKKQRVIKILAEVGLKNNAYYLYPHQLSGGMQQRAMIAMALINNPALLIADEPTTALDVTTTHAIIELLKTLMVKHGLSVLFITHNISLAATFAKRIGVMYAGRIVEISTAQKILRAPLHPYTERLIACLPERYNPGERIKTIEGDVPDFGKLPPGCPFHPRCSYRKGICMEKEPGEIVKDETTVRCFRYGNLSEDSKS